MRDILLVVFGAVLGAVLKPAIEGLVKLRADRRHRKSLRIVFENTDKPPYLVEVEFTQPAPLLKDGLITMTRRCYRVGVTSASEHSIPGVRVIVEAFKTRGERLPHVLVEGYALRLCDDNAKDTATIPSSQSAMPIFYDFVEQYEPESGEPSDWAWLCFKNTDEPHPSIPFGKSLVTLRVEAESGAAPQRARFWVQTRTPRAETLSGERDVRRTRLLVRRA